MKILFVTLSVIHIYFGLDCIIRKDRKSLSYKYMRHNARALTDWGHYDEKGINRVVYLCSIVIIVISSLFIFIVIKGVV